MRYFICNTPSACAVISVLHRAVDSAAEANTGLNEAISNSWPIGDGRGCGCSDSSMDASTEQPWADWPTRGRTVRYLPWFFEELPLPNA